MGEWDVDDMLGRMSWRKFVGWMRYYALEPFGEERADLRAGIVSAVIANAHRDPKKQRRPYAPRDFMPYSVKQKAYRPITDPSEWRRMTEAMRVAYSRAERGEE